MNQPVVLIVEDDTIARLVFRKLVSRLNIVSYEATNGQEGLKRIDEHPEITHVFLDLNMPILDGYGFLQQMNSGGNRNHINVIITSVADEKEFREITQNRHIDIANVSGYNKKPFDMAQLAHSITGTDKISK